MLGAGGVVALLVLVPLPAASAHESGLNLSPDARTAANADPGEACPGTEIAPDRVITGSFGEAEEKSYVMVPFQVPRGTTAVRVKYCFDGPDIPISTPAVSLKNTLDLGLYEPRRAGREVWGPAEFRGWGGSSHPDVTVSAEGFSTVREYTAEPRIDPPGKTTRAFLPGKIRPGLWAAELGVAAVLSPAEGNLDGEVAWRVEVELGDDPAFADDPYKPTRYRERPAQRRGGWYAGDMHVHAEHSAYGDATMREALDYALSARDDGGAGLDFVTLSDYVSGSSWGEIGRFQGRYRGKLIARSAEVITYEGHLNNHASGKVVDYRAGPVLERHADGTLSELRGPLPPSETFETIQRAGGFTQINHPTIFPSIAPGFAAFCRGCPWDYSDEETDYSRVDAIEIATGPADLESPVPGLDLAVGPNPFTVTAIGFYEEALATGARIAAVGVSDSHNAGRTPNPVTQAPIGEATTMVRAAELSEEGLGCAIEAGHTYVKVIGPGGPDLRLLGRPLSGDGGGRRAIFGDVIRSDAGARLTAVVVGGAGSVLVATRNGRPIEAAPVGSDRFKQTIEVTSPGRYGLQLNRGTSIEAFSTPIYVEPGPGLVKRKRCG